MTGSSSSRILFHPLLFPFDESNRDGPSSSLLDYYQFAAEQDAKHGMNRFSLTKGQFYIDPIDETCYGVPHRLEIISYFQKLIQIRNGYESAIGFSRNQPVFLPDGSCRRADIVWLNPRKNVQNDLSLSMLDLLVSSVYLSRWGYASVSVCTRAEKIARFLQQYEKLDRHAAIFHHRRCGGLEERQIDRTKEALASIPSCPDAVLMGRKAIYLAQKLGILKVSAKQVASRIQAALGSNPWIQIEVTSHVDKTTTPPRSYFKVKAKRDLLKIFFSFTSSLAQGLGLSTQLSDAKTINLPRCLLALLGEATPKNKEELFSAIYLHGGVELLLSEDLSHRQIRLLSCEKTK